MTRVEFIAALSAGLVVILTAAPSAAPLPPQDQGTVKDPVCSMSVKSAEARFKSEYQGKTYYFCSEGCKQKFDREPAKYLAPNESATGEQPVKDEVCGMTVKPADAKFKSEYRGKTYFFCSDSCKRKFDSEPAKYAHK